MKTSIEVDGVEYHGQYVIYEGDVIVVTLLPEWKQSTTLLGSSPAEAMAKILLREMVSPYKG